MNDQRPLWPWSVTLTLVLSIIGMLLLLFWLEPSVTTQLSRSDGADRLTTPEDFISNQNPCFSPDGTQLVFTRWLGGYNRGPAELVLFDFKTRTEKVLLTEPEAANVNVPGSCWDEATNSIVFASDRGDGFDEIWLINVTSGELRQITHHEESLAYLEPIFSPDGRQIVFEVNELSDDDDQQFGRIAVADRTTGTVSFLTDNPESIGTRPNWVYTDNRLPNWSSDGRILYQHRALMTEGDIQHRVLDIRDNERWSDWEVIIVEPDGYGRWNAARNVTNAPQSQETDNSWSSDGQWVVSSSDYGGLRYPNIWAFSVAGGQPVRLTNSSTHEDGAPTISPDGQWLAFESHRTSDEDSPTDLWLVPLSDWLKK